MAVTDIVSRLDPIGLVHQPGGLFKWLWEQPKRLLDMAARAYWSGQYHWHPKLLWKRHAAVTIDRPIFILGTQGGGLTLISRILRRHPTVVSFRGNCHCWAGPDEMLFHLRQFLPPSLALPGELDWAYATDQLLPQHRLDTALSAQERECLIAICHDRTRPHYLQYRSAPGAFRG